MDGGRRLLRSLREGARDIAPSSFAFAGVPASAPTFPSRRNLVALADTRLGRALQIVARPGGGTVLFFLLALLIVGYSAVRGGQYDAFVAAQGRPQDLVAKAFGFGIKAITISGARELHETDILTAAGVGPRNSLLFLDVSDVRDRLKMIPLVKDVSVAKLFPNRLLIEIEERQPYALWQHDGAVRIVASDGTPIDDLTDPHFTDLPLVVGTGANARLPEFMAILDAMGDLRSRVRAGMLVAERRWTLKMTNGVDVELPEAGPAQGIPALVRAQADGRLLDKDVVAIDLRDPQRIVVRLGDVAAAARAEMLARKTKTKSAP
jgi:cell division protein FtsQ